MKRGAHEAPLCCRPLDYAVGETRATLKSVMGIEDQKVMTMSDLLKNTEGRRAPKKV